MPALTHNIRAALFMLLAMAAFVVNDTMVKIATSTMSVPQIMSLRGIMATAILFALAWWRGAFRPMAMLMRPRMLVRTAAEIGATLFYIAGLSLLPLANASAIFQALPLAVTVGAALFLGEPVGWRRWAAIGVGFLGVLIIVRPGLDGFTAASLTILAAVACTALRDLITRRMPSDIPSLYVSVTTSAAVALTGWALVPAYGWMPVTPADLGALAVAAVAIGVGYVLIVEAMRTGDLGFVSPFRYSALIFALLIGVFVFGEVPDAAVLVGAFVIVASSFYALYRERVRGRVRPTTGALH